MNNRNQNRNDSRSAQETPPPAEETPAASPAQETPAAPAAEQPGDPGTKGPPGPTEIKDASSPVTPAEPVNGAGVPSVGGPPVAKNKKKVPPLVHPYQVAPGHSVVCNKGVLDGNRGDEIKAEWLGKTTGESDLANLVEKGKVLKGPDKK